MADLNPSARQVLLDLADRCEREEPSRELDTKIGQWFAHNAYEWWRERTGGFNFTSSLDAAVTLVPAGAWRETNGPRRYLNIPTPVPNYWHCQISLWEPTYSDFHGWAATETMAICAASLRARAEAL